MITDSEIDNVLHRSFQYILASQEFHVRNVRFQLNHYLYQGFKTAMSKNFTLRLINEEDWNTLVQPNPSVANELKDIDEKDGRPEVELNFGCTIVDPPRAGL